MTVHFPTVAPANRAYRDIYPPLEYAGLQFYSDTLSSAHYALVGGGLNVWTDLSNQNDSPSAPGPGGRPGFLSQGIGSQPAFQFNAGLYVGQTSGFPTGSYTKFILHMPDTMTNNHGNLISSGSSQADALFYNNGLNLMVYKGSNTATSLVYSYPANPEIVCQTWDATTRTATIYQNGVKSGAGTISSPLSGIDWQVGCFNSDSTQSYPGKIALVGFTENVLPPSDILKITNWIGAQWRLSMPFYVFDGDSLTFGYLASSPAKSYPYQFRGLLSTTMNLWNNAVPGSTLLDMDSRAQTGIDLLAYPSYSQGQILVAWGGTNDIAGPPAQTPATTYSRLVSYVTDRHNTNLYSQIVILTAIPRGSASLSDTLFSYNNLIRSGMQPGGSLLASGATLLCDLQQLSIFNTDTAWNNPTYYQSDNTHLTDTGYLQVAQALKTTLGL